jgi:hypothetical protein
MTTFAELEALVVAQTRRPEVPDITRAAIQNAVLRAHHVDFFPRDLRSAPITYTPSSGAIYYDVPDLSSTLSRLRALKFLQSLDNATFAPVEKLEYRESDDLYTSDLTRRQSMYTLIGDTLRVYPQAATGRLEAFYYQNPAVGTGTLTSWIADTYPDDLAMWAAGIVFSRTGFAEMARDVQETHVKPFKELLISSHLLGTVS